MIPFVVIGMPRTGSTLLATGLSQHPDITCYGELFHPLQSERKSTHFLLAAGRRISYDPSSDDAITFLRQNVFKESSSSSAIGFKLFGDFAKGPGTEGLFRRLKDDVDDLHAVHIFRENYLDALVSREVAKLTRSWVVYSGQRASGRALPDAIQLSITVETAERFFKAMEEVDGFYRRHFGGGEYRCVTYDRLESDFNNTMQDLFDFLEVSRNPVKPRTERQRTQSVPQTVTNYEELQRHFRATKYASFFR